MLYDISPPLTPDLPVWPGDTPLQREVLQDLSLGDSVTLSTLHTTVHLGAHADAPSHYLTGGQGIGGLELEPFLGPCQVIEVRAERGEYFDFTALQDEPSAPRILFRTGTFDRYAFNTDFAVPAAALVDELHAMGVVLIGMDSPSVDLFGSKDLPTHRMLGRHGMANLEGLQLEEVPPGHYELIALPLKLVGFDGSPVRAVLRKQ
ncbi:MAG: cyclase family protein [Gemmatimonadales bacterium]